MLVLSCWNFTECIEAQQFQNKITPLAFKLTKLMSKLYNSAQVMQEKALSSVAKFTQLAKISHDCWSRQMSKLFRIFEKNLGWTHAEKKRI